RELLSAITPAKADTGNVQARFRFDDVNFGKYWVKKRKAVTALTSANTFNLPVKLPSHLSNPKDLDR
ncbi:MAG TPA: hypothetical protein DER02_09610, partial [Gammaproteobacteria bacterium]|nr:hypothetical protein [Gammaproteobacteria bacterium]